MKCFLILLLSGSGECGKLDCLIEFYGHCSKKLIFLNPNLYAHCKYIIHTLHILCIAITYTFYF